MTPNLLSLAAPALLLTSLTAQITLVDANGVPFPTSVTQYGGPLAVSPTADVYMALDPTTPSGVYYMHVTDSPDGIGDEVLSTNDPLLRELIVTNTNGVITFAYLNSATAPTVGVGLNGFGQSLLVNPFRGPRDGSCEFKLQLGDSYDLSSPLGAENPHLIQLINPTTGLPAFAAFADFTIFGGTPGDVVGCVFSDLDQDGVLDAGEPGLAGWVVQLVSANATISTTTDANGNYAFVGVGSGSFTTELIMQTGYTATNALATVVESPGCAPITGGKFGVFMEPAFRCEARTIGFWRNRHGRNLVANLGLLPLLPALCIVDTCGRPVSFATSADYVCWLRRSNSWNMAYMLSAQLVAMHNNVQAGFVDAACVVDDPQLGVISISSLMAEAVMSLCAHPFTPPCSSHRAAQAALKNALDRANNNLTWM